jgi:hypothetical protein
MRQREVLHGGAFLVLLPYTADAHALVAPESLVAPSQPDDMVEHCDMHTSTQGPINVLVVY